MLRSLGHGTSLRLTANTIRTRLSLTESFPLRPSLTSRFLNTSTTDTSTIYALSTPPGRAAIAIIRCSGSACLDIYRALCPGTTLPKPRFATLRTLYGPDQPVIKSHALDSDSLILYFPAPKTVTGEDVIEFHVHGGPAIVKAVLSAITKCKPFQGSATHPIRYAEPGEFTRRAFYNDRLDLTQVEALGDTLSAETEQQRQLAVRSTSNTLNQRYESWRHLLLQARGELEALIDFSEDQHFDDSPAEFTASVAAQVTDLRRRIQASVENAAKGELLRGGIKIALLGAPNAGKSSLLNRIVGREAAIVSREAGTTRDVVEVNVDINGYFCKFGDLAGLRAEGLSIGGVPHRSIGEVETEGIRRAKAHALAADVVIVVLGLETDDTSLSGYSVSIDAEVADVLSRCDTERQKIIFAINKVDLLPVDKHDQLPKPTLIGQYKDAPAFHISCVDEGSASRGIQPLLEGLKSTFASLTEASALEEGMQGSWDDSLGASERQRLLLLQTLEHLDDFLSCVTVGHDGSPDVPVEIDVVVAAENLRAAAQSLGRITGRGEAGDVEEVLGVVFEKFCVGK